MRTDIHLCLLWTDAEQVDRNRMSNEREHSRAIRVTVWGFFRGSVICVFLFFIVRVNSLFLNMFVLYQ